MGKGLILAQGYECEREAGETQEKHREELEIQMQPEQGMGISVRKEIVFLCVILPGHIYLFINE